MCIQIYTHLKNGSHSIYTILQLLGFFFFFFHLIGNQESFMLLHRGQPHSLSWLHRIPGFVCVGPSIVPFDLHSSCFSWLSWVTEKIRLYVPLCTCLSGQILRHGFGISITPSEGYHFYLPRQRAAWPWFLGFSPSHSALWAASLVLSAISEVGRMHSFFWVQASDAPLIADA